MQKTKSSGSSPLRNSVYNHDDLKSQPETSDYRRRNTSNIEYPGRPRNRDTHMDERRRDYEHLYDNKQDTFYSRKDDYDEGRHNKSHDDRYNNHLSDTNYNYYVTERQLDNGFDVRNNINNIQKRRDHNEYDKYTSSRSSHISDKDPYGRYANQSSSNGHSRNTSYSSTNDLDSSRSNVHSPLPAVNPSYLDHIRHRATASDSSSVSTPSSPPTPNGFYDDDPRLRKSNGLDPRIYKDQIYSPAITSRPLTPRSNFPLEDDKDRYYRSSPLSPSYNKFHLDDNHRQSPSRNKFYLEDGNDYDDISHNYISSKRQPLLSSTLKDKPLTAKSPTPSIPRSYQSAYLSPPVTRATSPTRSSYTKKHHNYHYEATSPTLSPTYSSRPPSRATSVSSHATSIEEESVALTDILQAADSLTLRNLSEQLKIFRHREFSPPSSVKSTSRSTPGTRRPSVTTTKNSTNTTRGIKSSSAPGTPNAAQKKKNYTLDKRSQPTDFSAAREALNRAKLKVEEMLELVSNNGSV
ncbi:24264_t:CDS:2 [Dentiscutata erythropus]|uniref:24264_t:CDS:1 n=1 Tax=Dentiscutata erythropus TaxID=1348616 RepID=A0A9N9BH13_9GLOM|nr:24264_t:CDS:2 [Dentiscutata erythropus]